MGFLMPANPAGRVQIPQPQIKLTINSESKPKVSYIVSDHHQLWLFTADHPSMASPSPSLNKSIPSNLRICTTCEGPMRGHTRVDRKYVCPPREKLVETLQQLLDEGHRDFVTSITKKHAIHLPSSPQISTPLASASLVERLRQRRPTQFPLADELEEIKPKIEESVSSVTSNLRRMINKVIDERREPHSPPRSPSLSSSDTTIPDTSSEGLPAIGPWNAQRLRDWSAPPDLDDLPPSERASLVPTLLIGSDGRTIREGSRAEAHFRAQAALEARGRHRGGTPYPHSPPASESLEEISVIHHQPDDRDYEGSGFHRVLRSVVASPAIMAIPVRSEDVARVRETATRHGLHTSVLEVIPRTPGGSSALPQIFRNALISNGEEKSHRDEDDRPIVVIGRDLTMTQRYVEMAQRGVMPGTVSYDQFGGPRLITMSQFMIMMAVMVILIFALFFFFFLWSGR